MHTGRWVTTWAIACLLSVLPAMVAAADEQSAAIDAVLLRDPPRDAEHPASVVELTIPSHGRRLPGHIYLAAGAGPHPTVILLHGLPGNERNLDIAQALRRFGFNTLYFHYRGAWGAEGDYRFSHLPEDALAVLEYLREPERARELRVDTSALSLLGHSLGGFTALAAGARDDDLRCVIALSPANLAPWKAGMEDADSAGARELAAYADQLFMLNGLSGQRLREELAYIDIARLDTTAFAAGLRNKAVLIMVGEGDRVTPAASMFDPVVAAYAEAGGMDLTARKIPGDHSFSETRLRLTREILAWSDSHCR